MLPRLIGTIVLSFALLCAFNLPGVLAAPAKPAAVASAPTADAPRMIPAETMFANVLENAEKGQPQAIIALGSLYERGIGTPRNFTSAMQWYEKAAAAGSAEGYSRLAICYEVGVGVTANIDTAIKNYQKAASLGFAAAEQRLASFYLEGRGVPKDVTKGIDLLTKAAEKWAPASNDLAPIYLHGLYELKVDQKRALDLLSKAAEQGYVESMKNLTIMYKDGLGRKADPVGALRWYLTAQKDGFNTPDLPTVIDDLKKGLKPAQIKQAETEADKWIAAFQAKNQQVTKQ